MTKMRDKLSRCKDVLQGYAAVGLLLADPIISRKSLYRNHDFRLIHVKKIEDGPLSMRIVSPASDRAVRKQLKTEDFYALSHLWGPDAQCKPWTSHGIIGDDGNPITVRIRPKKQETMLALFEAHPGFWWVDLFCTQSTTPLVIMGDIYRLCSRCYALIDFPEDGFGRIKTLSERLEVFMSEDDNRLPDGYKKQIADKFQETNGSWHKTYNDLLGWWYNGDRDDIKALGDFSDCQWFKRVWTLQEYILPNKLIFVSEDGSPENFLYRLHITKITQTLVLSMVQILQSYLEKEFGDYFGFHQWHFGLSPERMDYITNTPGASRCYQDLTRTSAAHYYFSCAMSDDTTQDDYVEYTGPFGYKHESIRALKLRYISSKLDFTGLLLSKFAKMSRECMDPCDYVYGVAGLLDFNIPRTTNHRQVWASFREIVQKRVPEVTIPEEFDLSSAKSMQGVYKFIVEKNPETIMDRLRKLFSLMDAVICHPMEFASCQSRLMCS